MATKGRERDEVSDFGGRGARYIRSQCGHGDDEGDEGDLATVVIAVCGRRVSKWIACQKRKQSRSQSCHVEFGVVMPWMAD